MVCLCPQVGQGLSHLWAENADTHLTGLLRGLNKEMHVLSTVPGIQ